MNGAELLRNWQRVRNRAFSLALSSSFQSFGTKSVIQSPVRLKGEDRIAIGAGVFIGAGSWLQTMAQPDEEPPLIEIGDRTSMSGMCVISAARHVQIGRAVLFARNVYVADHSHEYHDTSLPVLDQGLTGIAPVRIGDGAWLGQNTVVCPGVTIGPGAVIGANSVVRSDIPGWSVAAGAPATVRRQAPPSVRPVSGSGEPQSATGESKRSALP